MTAYLRRKKKVYVGRNRVLRIVRLNGLLAPRRDKKRRKTRAPSWGSFSHTVGRPHEGLPSFSLALAGPGSALRSAVRCLSYLRHLPFRHKLVRVYLFGVDHSREIEVIID